jgi:hypothetical protein
MMTFDLPLPSRAPELSQWDECVWNDAAFEVYTLLRDTTNQRRRLNTREAVVGARQRGTPHASHTPCLRAQDASASLEGAHLPRQGKTRAY